MAKSNKISLLESLLFSVGRPLSYKELADFLELTEKEATELIDSLQARYNQPDSGLRLITNNHKVQMTTAPENGQALNDYFKAELSGELTRASLETLTIIAYRQPISREELEQIRGVNCSLIIRNLMIRGLIEAQDAKGELATKYSVTIDFLRHLGINGVQELPDFDKLNSNENLLQILQTDTSVDQSAK